MTHDLSGIQWWLFREQFIRPTIAVMPSLVRFMRHVKRGHECLIVYSYRGDRFLFIFADCTLDTMERSSIEGNDIAIRYRRVNLIAGRKERCVKAFVCVYVCIKVMKLVYARAKTDTRQCRRVYK